MSEEKCPKCGAWLATCVILEQSPYTRYCYDCGTSRVICDRKYYDAEPDGGIVNTTESVDCLRRQLAAKDKEIAKMARLLAQVPEFVRFR